MNINEAKNQIKHSVISYLTKDQFGNYVIPKERQRPFFILGAPGIGKTAIMKQISQELNIGLISYSMAHHTRQSAIGLPIVTKNVYGGVEYNTTEYTMSEIIAAVYDLINESGIQEGILFLDEVNCISETLTPAMLQFLQFKIFGQHHLPEGWIVVTAGNPSEFNKSVTEFDLATLDRIRTLKVEPEFSSWVTYAVNSKIHLTILNYLKSHSGNFYVYETRITGKEFITPRAWEDLSEILKTYELNKLVVDFHLIEQYLQKKEIAFDFLSYYELYTRFQNEFSVDMILTSSVWDEMAQKMKGLKIDERLLIVSMLFEEIESNIIHNKELKLTLDEIYKSLQKLKGAVNSEKKLNVFFTEELSDHKNRIHMLSKSGLLTKGKQNAFSHYESKLTELSRSLNPSEDFEGNYGFLKNKFLGWVEEYNKTNQEVESKMNNALRFIDATFETKDEMNVFLHLISRSEQFSGWIHENGVSGLQAYMSKSNDTSRREAIMDKLKNIM